VNFNTDPKAFLLFDLKIHNKGNIDNQILEREKLAKKIAIRSSDITILKPLIKYGYENLEEKLYRFG
jgi:hypothetical protein